MVPSENRKDSVLSGFTVTSTTPQEPEPPEPELREAWREAIWPESTTRYSSSVMPSTAMPAGVKSVAKMASNESKSSAPMLPLPFSSGL